MVLKMKGVQVNTIEEDIIKEGGREGGVGGGGVMMRTKIFIICIR